MKIRRPEREYADIRRHLREDHGFESHKTVTLATFLRHRRLHEKNIATIPHTHSQPGG